MAMDFTVTAGTTCELVERPTSVGDGTPQLRYRAVYNVHTPNIVPGQAAIQLGRVNGPDRLPARGAAFDLTIGPTGSSTRFRDPSAFALDFTATPIDSDEDHPTIWVVEVIWRQPVWGQDEVPATASRPPWQRTAEFKWDWMDEQESVTTGIEVTRTETEDEDGDTKVSYTLGSKTVTMINTAGEPVSPEIVRDRLLVGRFIYNSTDPLESVKQTSRYRRTVNDRAFRLRGLLVDKHYARFLSCEQVFAGVYNGIDYYRCEMRIQIGHEPFYVKRESRGKLTYTAASGDAEKREQAVDTRGLPRGIVPLDEHGQPADASHDGTKFDPESNPPHTQRWLAHRPVRYTLRF